MFRKKLKTNQNTPQMFPTSQNEPKNAKMSQSTLFAHQIEPNYAIIPQKCTPNYARLRQITPDYAKLRQITPLH
jgi:hypothetical protein